MRYSVHSGEDKENPIGPNNTGTRGYRAPLGLDVLGAEFELQSNAPWKVRTETKASLGLNVNKAALILMRMWSRFRDCTGCQSFQKGRARANVEQKDDH